MNAELTFVLISAFVLIAFVLIAFVLGVRVGRKARVETVERTKAYYEEDAERASAVIDRFQAKDLNPFTQDCAGCGARLDSEEVFHVDFKVDQMKCGKCRDAGIGPSPLYPLFSGITKELSEAAIRANDDGDFGPRDEMLAIRDKIEKEVEGNLLNGKFITVAGGLSYCEITPFAAEQWEYLKAKVERRVDCRRCGAKVGILHAYEIQGEGFHCRTCFSARMGELAAPETKGE